mgnify:CR=1 FL=1
MENQEQAKLLEILFILSTDLREELELSLLRTTLLRPKLHHVSKHLVLSPTKIIIKVFFGWDKLDLW